MSGNDNSNAVGVIVLALFLGWMQIQCSKAIHGDSENPFDEYSDEGGSRAEDFGR